MVNGIFLFPFIVKERTEFERYIFKMEMTQSTLNQELEKVNKDLKENEKKTFFEFYNLCIL
jgi:hypothetical protein